MKIFISKNSDLYFSTQLTQGTVDHYRLFFATGYKETNGFRYYTGTMFCSQNKTLQRRLVSLTMIESHRPEWKLLES